jgi:hypothetical protein
MMKRKVKLYYLFVFAKYYPDPDLVLDPDLLAGRIRIYNE